MAVLIASTGASIPEQRVSNEELATRVETSDEWIRSHSGIGARHIAPKGVMTSDLAAAASREALARAGIEASRLDVLILATATPDYFGFPSTACVVQAAIGADRAAAFDIVAGCTGFIYALDVASAMLEARGGRYALVIGAETLSRLVDWSDRSTCVLFGDGSGAVVLERRDAPAGRGIRKTILGADGRGKDELFLVQDRRDDPYARPEIPTTPRISMNGRGVYAFAVGVLTDMLRRFREEEGTPLESYRWIVPHQANARIVQAAAKRFGLPEDRFFMNIDEYANTSAASIPIALHDIQSRGLVEEGDSLMLLGFGAGLTYGGCVLGW